MLIVLVPLKAESVEISLGGMTWYSWWSAWYEMWNPVRVVTTKEIINQVSVNPSFLYGPLVSMRLPRHVQLSTTVLYGEFEKKRRGWLLTSSSSAPLVPVTDNNRIRRVDWDTSMSVSLNRYLKLFGGFKYGMYRCHIKKTALSQAVATSADVVKLYNEFAPGLGFGVTVRVIQNFFFQCSSSFVVKFVDYSNKGSNLVLIPTGNYLFPENYKRLIYKVGCNSNINFAYWIEPIKTTVSIGFRYQVYRTIDPGKDGGQKFDHFYGATALVMYRLPAMGVEEKDEP